MMTDECDDSDQKSVANLQKESCILLGCRDHQCQTNSEKDFIDKIRLIFENIDSSKYTNDVYLYNKNYNLTHQKSY